MEPFSVTLACCVPAAPFQLTETETKFNVVENGNEIETEKIIA